MKTVGIIGGLGPETSAHFYMEIIKHIENAGALQRPGLLLWNVPLFLDIERDLILRSFGEKRYIPLLLDACQRLEKAGSDFIVMPCNTLHIFIELMRKSVSVPMLSIVDVTVEHLIRNKIDKVGILATTTTIRSCLFQKAFDKADIQFVIPSGSDQNRLSQIIVSIINGKYDRTDKQDLQEFIKRMRAKNVLLACTDLQLLIGTEPWFSIIDTMFLLAQSVGDELLM